MERISIRYLAIVLILILNLSSCTEDVVTPILTGTISGVSINKTTNAPVENVEINTIPATNEVYTNDLGEFIIENIPIGEYTVYAKAFGFENENIKINVTNNEVTDVTLKLNIANRIASIPINPIPQNNAIDQALTLNLIWSISDQGEQENLKYQILLYEDDDNQIFQQVDDYTDTTLTVEDLNYNSNYFWQVNVISSTGNITKGDIWSFSTVAFPDNRFLFTSNREGDYNIYSSDLEGGKLTQITENNDFELKPLYSNNRDLIAYSSNAEVDYHIYLMDKDGSNPKKVTNIPIAGFHNQGIAFCWSPDNGKLLYSHYEKLYTINRNGTGLNQIATAPNGKHFRSSDWTSVNDKIVVETIGSTIYESEIYLMNSDGSDTIRLVDDLPGIIQNPSFSIDGKEVLYTQDISGYESANGRQLNAHIFKINIETKEITDLSNNKPNGTNDLQARFSPDGASIIFMNTSNDGSGLKSIWKMDTNGTNRTLLFEDAEMPNWQ